MTDEIKPAAAATGTPAIAPSVEVPKPVVEAAKAEVDEPSPPPSAERVALRPEGKRLFVGVRVSTGTANALAKAAEMLARRAREGGLDIKWVPPVNYHLTFKFLGWTRIETIGAIEDALEHAIRGTPRITFRTSRVGGFPSIDKTTVLWAGVEDSGEIAKLAARIEGALTGIGYEPETRAFHPHVTLARMRETRLLKEVVLPVTEQMFGDTRIEAVTLFESETNSSGSVYREISRIDFKQAETTAERQTRAVDLGAPTQTSESDDTDDGWPRGQGPNH
ncbi:MAG: RNA 2',3'-cyclic phosphodiesterase [Deltaproteobacteria bacterium]|nr:RNA 2',3'-cyclic phosphodiesterase [Deltaproteobacteria bacterium]